MQTTTQARSTVDRASPVFRAEFPSHCNSRRAGYEVFLGVDGLYHVSVFCITDEAFARHRQNAQLVCNAVNSYLRISDALTKKL